MKNKKYNSEFYFKLLILLSFSASLCYLLLTAFQQHKIFSTSILGISFLLSSIIFIITSIVYFAVSKGFKINHFYIKFFAASLSIMLFTSIYPYIPTLNSKIINTNSALRVELMKQYKKIKLYVDTNDYNSLNKEYILSKPKIGYMNFNLGKNLRLEHNISRIDLGDYVSRDYTGDIIFGDSEFYLDSDKEKEITASSRIDSIEKPVFTFIDNNYGYLDLKEKDVIQNSTSAVFSIVLKSDSPSKCFDISSETFYANTKDTVKDKVQKVCELSDKGAVFSYVMDMLKSDKEQIEKIRIYIKPNLDDTNSFFDKKWQVVNTQIRADKSGLGKYVGDICVDGYLDSEPENIISIYNGKLLHKSCPLIA